MLIIVANMQASEGRDEYSKNLNMIFFHAELIFFWWLDIFHIYDISILCNIVTAKNKGGRNSNIFHKLLSFDFQSDFNINDQFELERAFVALEHWLKLEERKIHGKISFSMNHKIIRRNIMWSCSKRAMLMA